MRAEGYVQYIAILQYSKDKGQEYYETWSYDYKIHCARESVIHTDTEYMWRPLPYLC